MPSTYVCNGANQASDRRAGGIVFLGKVRSGETLIAEAQEAGARGASRGDASCGRTADGRAIAEFTGYSRTIGRSVVDV